MKTTVYVRVFFLFINIFLFYATSAQGQPVNLQHLANSGKIPRGILNKLEISGEAEILVHIEENDFRTIAQTKMKGRGLKFQDMVIVEEKSRLYTNRKNQIVSRLARNDYQVEHEYDFLPVMHMTVNSQSLLHMLQMDEVDSVSENLILYPHLTQSLGLINAPAVHVDGSTGVGTAVAVLDTGVNYTHSAFGSCTGPDTPATCKVVYVEDFATDDGALDDDGHGTNVSGIVVGVAPDTKIIGLDVFDGDGAWYSDIIGAMNWVLANGTNYNIVAVNMSLGNDVSYPLPCGTDGLSNSISALKDAGIATIISSGNDGYTTGIASPACVPDAISVGAVYDANVGGINYSSCTDYSTAADKVTCFSNSVDYLTLLAPGSIILAAGTSMAGTSQAAPHVAGAVAVLNNLYGFFSVDDIVNQLTGTGVPVTDPRNTVTTPRLDLYSAVNAPQPASTSFTALPSSGNAPLLVNFSDQTPWSPNVWTWDFGDAQTSTVQNPTHMFEQPGTYIVSLAAANDLGSDFFTQSLTVSSCPNLPVTIDSLEFSSLQAAYASATDGAIIQSHAVAFSEDLLMDQDIVTTLEGGFNCEYSASATASKIVGSLTISNGTVLIDKLVIQ